MINICLADDHTLFREGLKQIIQREPDFAVVGEASNGQELLLLLKSYNPDILILDISMPDTNVFSLINSLKQLNPSIKILILSMHPEDQYAVRMLQLGVAGYLTKESAGTELLTALRKIDEGGRYISSSLAELLVGIVTKDQVSAPYESLSNREYEVMCMIASGKSLKEIASILFISEKTVTTYRTRIIEKMGFHNNAELITYVLKNNLI